MSQSRIRIVAAAIAFAVVAIGGIVTLNFSGETAVTSWAYVTLAALGLAFLLYAAIEYIQTRSFDSITSQFDTRTIVLIPIAIALNIILGQTVAAAIKLPIYLDSIGTILVAVLAGPLAGALTGLLSNLLWTFVLPPPFHSDFAAAFAIVAVVIGLMAGHVLTPRLDSNRDPLPTAPGSRLGPWRRSQSSSCSDCWRSWAGRHVIQDTSFLPSGDPLFVALGFLSLLMVVVTIVGLAVLLFVKRDLTAAYVVVAGVITGIVAALISAPISANLFSGVTGSGTDFLVAAFRQGGAEIGAATLGQGLISDPIDKVVTFGVVYVILGAMAIRTKARFPLGEKLVNVEDAA